MQAEAEHVDRFAAVVDALVGLPGITPPMGGAGFGAKALKVRGKIFAMRVAGGALVVKLPQRRVDALIAAGCGERFDPGHGRVMKEWLAVAPAADLDWPALAREAMAYVASG